MNNSELLEEVRHELVSLSGLRAFDKKEDESFELDYSNLIEKIDEVIDVEDTSIESFVLDNCIEWYNLISELSKKEEELYSIKELYARKEFFIVYMDDSIDFKAMYGSTAEKVRKQHAKNKLRDLDEEIKSLELSVDYCKRRLSYLKGLVTVKTALIDAKKE